MVTNVLFLGCFAALLLGGRQQIRLSSDAPCEPLSRLPFVNVTHRSIRKSHPSVRAEVMSRVKCLVVDEVDRLVDVVSKHAPPKEVEKRKRHARPIAALLEKILRAKPDVQVTTRLLCMFCVAG